VALAEEQIVDKKQEQLLVIGVGAARILSCVTVHEHISDCVGCTLLHQSDLDDTKAGPASVEEQGCIFQKDKSLILHLFRNDTTGDPCVLLLGELALDHEGGVLGGQGSHVGP